MEEKLKILVVDNNKVESMAAYLALKEADMQIDIYQATDVNNALSTLKNVKFDYVFLDYCLPKQDSFTFTHKLNFLGIKVPVVIITIPGEEEIAVNLIKAGATEYFLKSEVSSENLPMILRSVKRLHQAKMKVDSVYQQLHKSHEQLNRKNQELEQQRRQIQLQNLQLIETSRLKSQFLATISHELRTPMNAIIGFSQILLRPKFGNLTHKQTDMVERVLNNGKHLLSLVNEVLDFAKIESGKLDLKVEIFDLAKIVHSTVTEIRSLAESKNLSLFLDINLENTFVLNDPVRIRQILLNLLSNAVKFTEFGSIWVEVKEQNQDRITITIKDTGIGISSQNFQNIFEAFRQVDQGINREYTGTGLGLAIINSLVRMMGGKILLESQLGVGSVFKIDIPRQMNVSASLGSKYHLNLISGDDAIYHPHSNSFPIQTQFNKVVKGNSHLQR